MRDATFLALCLASSAALAGDPVFDEWRARQRAWVEQKRKDDLEREKEQIRAAAEITKAQAVAEALRPPPVEVIVVSPQVIGVPIYSPHHGFGPHHHRPHHYGRGGYRRW